MPSADPRNTLRVEQEVRRGKGHPELPSGLHGRDGVHFLIIAPTVKSQISGDKRQGVFCRNLRAADVYE